MVSREYRLLTGPVQGVLGAAFGAKKAALSADRLAQNLDPANTRGEEGAVETRLYTSLEGVTGSRRIPICSREDAQAEAGRCIQCRCEECLKGCAYLRHYQKFPRILTREIYNNVSIIMGDHMMNKPINACSLCGQCRFTCPNGYDMGEICHMARQNMVFTGKMPLAPHEFALQDMLFSNEEAFLCRPQPALTGAGMCSSRLSGQRHRPGHGACGLPGPVPPAGRRRGAGAGLLRRHQRLGRDAMSCSSRPLSFCGNSWRNWETPKSSPDAPPA